MSIYTKTGDAGITMLQDGKPIPKHHPVIQAMAALDELNAHVGMVRSQISTAEPPDDIEQIQKNIMTIMSLISTTAGKKPPAHSRTGHKTAESNPALTGSGLSTGWDEIFADEVTVLESKIDKLTSVMPAMTSFVTYGTCPKSATIDLARAVARRAETSLTQIAETCLYAKTTLAYINRLSDYLYVKARYADFEHTVTQAVKDVLSKTDTSAHSGEISPEAPTANCINLTQAKSMLEKIEHKAKESNLPIVAACVNASGNPVALHVMDGAFLISYEAALAKAYTSAALKMPTAELNRLVQPGQPFYGLESIGGGKILPIGGGVPLFDRDGQLVGAIGVSGGTAEQDHELANSFTPV